MAQLMPLPLSVSCFSKIRTGFTFLVPAHLGSPRKGAVKCVCQCVCVSSNCTSVLLCRETAGSYDTCSYWSVCSLDDLMRTLSPDRLLVSFKYSTQLASSILHIPCISRPLGLQLAYGPADVTASQNPVISHLI